MTVTRALTVILLAVAVLPAAVLAAAPRNDDRADAQTLADLPVRVSGTTVDATLDAADPGSRCAPTKNSVFYSFRADADRRIVLNLDAAGDLDAVVDVFRRVRSQLEGVACEATDTEGTASFAFRVKKGESFLIRVSQRTNSLSGTFSLALGVSVPDARPPGTALPSGGRRDTVDRVLNPSDAWSVRLRTGVTYRINVATLGTSDRDRCVRASLFPPGTRDFESDDSVQRKSCGGYMVFTPASGEGGRYSILVEAVRGRGALPYNVEVAPAGSDDLSPGIFLRNDSSSVGELSGARIDVIDVYRFDITKPSTLALDLSTSGHFDLLLVRDDGRRVECSCAGEGDQEIDRRIGPGRYFVAVRAQSASGGTYRLHRLSRAVTSSRILINGKRGSQIAPGSLARIGVRVSPGVSGPVNIFIDRFDPIAGWQFFTKVSARANGGIAIFGFTPPSIGRYRARAEYLGTRTSSPSRTGYARVLVAGPLRGD